MYPIHEIEDRWRKWWEAQGIYRTTDRPEPDRKFYVLEMFAYPSGDLHIGHLRNYVLGDVLTRYKMMQGYQVLHPVGWDAFGLPAENAAIRHGIHPRDWTMKNIEISRESYRLMGISYDWTREILTCEPKYYKWTQWIFLLLYKRGLAYRKPAYVNWCPNCQTVLANEQVSDGRCWRCSSVVVKRKLTQWFFKITAYAERLLDDLKYLEGKWPDEVINLQRNWIGKSEGVRIVFRLPEFDKQLPVFTTRADTVFGVTFIAIAPEHEVLEGLPLSEEVHQYIERSLRISEIERTSREREKTGVFTGMYAVHPFTGERIPIYVCDYVLATYGTGIVMGVPAHDQRDFEFAKKYGLPIKVVIKPVDGELSEPLDKAYEEYGVMVQSGKFTGLTSEEGISAVADELKAMGLGGREVQFHLRDWLVSRQRYWGAPIPMIHCPRCGVVPVPEEELPVRLPEVVDYAPKGKSPLESVPEFINTKCPRCGGDAKRDPDTMDTFVDSSWYQLRYTDPHNDNEIFDLNVAKRWLPIDQYIGGIEHATGHLIYFRFITKVLYDAGISPVSEPALRLFTQGMILNEDGKVMSSSKGTAVPVRPLVQRVGADVARVGVLFLGPPEKEGIWSERVVEGARRFLDRVYRIVTENLDIITENVPANDSILLRKINYTIKKVTEDIEHFHYNTAIAALMELVNEFYKSEKDETLGYGLYTLVKLIAPFAPYLAEELWHRIGGEGSVFHTSWPQYDPAKVYLPEIEIPVQVDGKLRARLQVPFDVTEDDIRKRALEHPKIRQHIMGKQVKRIIVVPKKLINIVTK